MADRYVELPRAQLTPDYLHANSTTHEFLFGALAELVDNARDARATHLSIYTEENEQRTGGMVLCFLDDGVGMDPDEAADVIHLGKSSKRTSDYPFSGQYGNGLKSGAMRIGMDFILFTKKTNTMTCILLSRTFYEKEGIDEVIVPVPSWFVSTQEPIKTDDLTFSIEMALIYKYSPFSTEFDVMQQFHKITGSSGTLLIIYNVKLNDDGEPELDVVSDPSDLLLTGMVRSGIQPEHYSFRAYAAILYIDPYMKIYIQGKTVCAKPLIFSLYRPRKYTYFSKGFKVRTLREVKEAELAVKVAEEKMQEAKLKMREFEKTCDDGMEEQNKLTLAKARTKLSDSQKDVERKKKLYQEKLRALKKPIKLTFIFGVNIENRNCDGMFIYNNCRLIKMYKRIGVQLDCGLRSCDGVVGVVNVPSAMMEPTHNKQDFADAREYHSLLRVMGQCLLQYWKGLDIARAGIVKFWNEFGYVSTNWDWPPSAAVQYRRRRAAEIPVTVQCDLCLRWRVLPSNVDVNDEELPDPWICSMNQNPQQNRCDIAEQLPKIPSGAIKARSPLSNEKQERLEKSIQRHWVKVASLQSQRTFPTEPLAHRLPADSSNKSLSKGITVPKRYPCPLTSRKRHVAASRSPRCTRSHYSARVPFSGNKRSRTSGCEEVAQIRRDFRPSVLCSEKQPCTSQHSVEDRRITKSLLAKKSNYQVFRKEQIGTCNSNMEIPQKELTREITSELIAVPVNVCGKSPISSHSKYLTQAMVKIESTNGDTIGSIHKPFFRWEVKENIVVCSDPERFQGGISLSELCSDVEQVDLTRPMINRGVLKGLVTCFGNLLSHFVPSNYHIPKEKLDNLGAEELVTFPMHDYFIHYERTLRRRLQSTAEGAISRAQELEQKMQQVETQLRETKEKLRFYQNVMDLLLNRNCTPLPEDN